MVTIDENGNSTTIETNKCNLQKGNFHGTFGDDLLKIGWDVTLPWDEFNVELSSQINQNVASIPGASKYFLMFS